MQFDRYNEMWDELDSAVTEMAYAAADLRKVWNIEFVLQMWIAAMSI